MVAMAHRTTVRDRDKIYLQAHEQLKAALASLGQWTFAAADAGARRHGWQVYPTHFGLGQRYRDRRFDALAACPDCRRLVIKAADGPQARPPLGMLP